MSLHRSQHEEFENQPDELEREEMISRPRRKSRKKTIFFWILLILVIALGIGGHVLHEHYLMPEKRPIPFMPRTALKNSAMLIGCLKKANRSQFY